MASTKTKIIRIEHHGDYVYLVSFSMKGVVVSTGDVEKATRFTRQGAYSLCTRIKGHGEFAIPSDSPEQEIAETERREELKKYFEQKRIEREG